MYFVILFFFFLAIGLCYFFTIQTVIALFTPEYSKVPNFACLDGCSGIAQNIIILSFGTDRCKMKPKLHVISFCVDLDNAK